MKGVYAVKLSSKLQVVVPREIREHLRVDAGDYIAFIINDKGEVLVKKAKVKQVVEINNGKKL